MTLWLFSHSHLGEACPLYIKLFQRILYEKSDMTPNGNVSKLRAETSTNKAHQKDVTTALCIDHEVEYIDELVPSNCPPDGE